MGIDLNDWVKLSHENSFEELRKKLDSNEKAIDSNAEKIFNQINQLDLKSNSLLFCYVISGLKVNLNTFQIFDRFLKVFDGKQVKLGLGRLNSLTNRYLDFMVSNKNGIKCIRGLQVAINSLNSAQAGLTQLHLWFLQLCIENRFYKQAVQVIRQPIVNLDKKADVTDVDLFQYYYKAGQVMTVTKNFSEAIVFFEDCFSFQSRNIHEIHVEAKKMLILLNLRKGKMIEKKKDHGERERNGENKVIELTCDTYLSLNDLNVIQDIQAFDQYVAQNIDYFTDDGNMGLVNQCKYSVVMHQLKKIKKVYMKYRLDELYKTLGFQQQQLPIEVLLFEINKIKPIFTINKKFNCIEFKPKDEADHEDQILNPLANSFDLLQSVFKEFQKENQENIKEKLRNPGTTYC